MKIYRSILKVVVLLIVFGSILIPIKRRKANRVKDSYANIAPNSAMFIGTSRTAKGINPENMLECFEPSYILNLGRESQGFLGNSLLAEYLINHAKPKVIIFELSVVRNPANGLKLLSRLETNIIEKLSNPPFKGLLNTSEFPGILEKYFFLNVSLAEQFKKIFAQHIDDEIRGYIPSIENNTNSDLTFLDLEENRNDFNDKSILGKYNRIVDFLIQLATEKNIEIYFYLPLTNLSDFERDLVWSIFERLKEENKIRYTDTFLKDIRKAEYLSDANHLNSEGAIKLSTFFCSLNL